MDVIVDGDRNFRFEGQPRDLLSAVSAIDAWLRERNRAIRSLKVDGKALTPESLVNDFENGALEAAATLEVQSSSIPDMVRQCIAEMNEVLPDLANACRGLAAVFHGETPEDGFDPFQELAGIWENIKTRQMLVADALQLDLAELQLNGAPLSAIHDELNRCLEEAEEALRAGDCVLLGDLLEYELAPRAEREVEIAVLLGTRAASNL